MQSFSNIIDCQLNTQGICEQGWPGNKRSSSERAKISESAEHCPEMKEGSSTC